MALKMKFLESNPINAEDQIRYPVSYANGIYLKDGTRTVQDFIDSFNVNNGGDNSINLPKDCVNTDQIVNYAVTSGKIAASAIIEEKIADNAITNAKVTSYNKDKRIGGLGGDKLKDNAVTEDKIADGAVTLQKAAFGQIELIYSGVPVGTSNKASVTGLDKYRCLILGVTTGGPSTIGNDGTQNGGSMLTTTIIPLIQEPEGSFVYRPFTNSHQALFPDIKADGTGSQTSYAAFFQFDSNSTSSGKVWLSESTGGASYSGLVLFGIK